MLGIFTDGNGETIKEFTLSVFDRLMANKAAREGILFFCEHLLVMPKGITYLSEKRNIKYTEVQYKN